MLAEHGFAVLGIDAFLVTDDGAQPLMEYSIDFSASLVENDTVYQKVIDFLRARDLNLWFEIVAAPK